MKLKIPLVITKLPRVLLLPVFVGLVIFTLYGWKLGSLTPGMSIDEIRAKTESASIQKIANYPTNAPHKLVQYGLQRTGHDRALAMRLASVIFGLVFLLCFYFTLRLWFGKLIGLVGSLLLAGWPWFILLSRSATPEIMFFMPITVVASFLWLQSTKKHKLAASLSLAVVGSLGLYVPGMIWLLLFGAALYGKRLFQNLKQGGQANLVIAILTMLVLVAPLIWALARNWLLIKQLALIPENWPGVVEAIKSIAWAGLGLVWRTREHLTLGLGLLPLMNAAFIILGTIGLFWVSTQFRARRTYMLTGSLAISILLAGLGGNFVYVTLGLPALGIIVVSGLNYLYKEWSDVFPRNPFAKVLAVSLILMLLVVNFAFGGRYTLLAWPHSPAVKSTYVLK